MARFNYIAQDRNGLLFFHATKPVAIVETGEWRCARNDYKSQINFMGRPREDVRNWYYRLVDLDTHYWDIDQDGLLISRERKA